MAAALERNSEHPLAKAIRKKAENDNIVPADVTDFAVLPGNGLTATLDGATLYGGNLAFIQTKAVIPNTMQQHAATLAQEGKTPLFFVKDKTPVGMIAVADVIKQDSTEAIAALKKMGMRVVMLTGDNERTANAIAEQVGVDEVIAEVLPDGKEAVIHRLQQQGRVAMVGDGINDAPALTRSDVGIAIGAGTDIAIDAADIVLARNRLSDVPAALRLSHATIRNIRQNLFWAFVYNIIGIPLAAGVWFPLFGLKLNPMFGAAAMSLSSACVVGNALRLNFVRIHQNKSIREKNNMKKTLKIEGMMCPHCEARVKNCLDELVGITEAVVDHKTGMAVVTLSADISDEMLKKTVETQGYPVTEIK